MSEAYICDAIRTPVGRYGGALSSVRPDDLAAITLKALMDRNPDMDQTAIDDIYMGCANQAGEDNRNVARMSSLLAGFSETVPSSTINRLCGSSMDAIGIGARGIKVGEIETTYKNLNNFVLKIVYLMFASVEKTANILNKKFI